MNVRPAPGQASASGTSTRSRVAAAVAVSLMLHAGLAAAFIVGRQADRRIDVGGTAVAVTLVSGPMGGHAGGEVETAGPSREDAGPAGGEDGNPDARASEPARPDGPAVDSPEPQAVERARAGADDTADGGVRPAVPPPRPPAKPGDLRAPGRAVASDVPPPAPKPARVLAERKSAVGESSARRRGPASTANVDDTARLPAAGGVRPAASASQPRSKQLASLPPTGSANGRQADGETNGAASEGGPTGGGRRAAAPLAGNPAPGYPRRARQRGWEGRVVLEVVVQPDGRAGRVEVVDSSGYAELDDAAAAAVRDWRFRPAERDGAARRDVVRIPVRFDLRG